MNFIDHEMTHPEWYTHLLYHYGMKFVAEKANLWRLLTHLFVDNILAYMSA